MRRLCVQSGGWVSGTLDSVSALRTELLGLVETVFLEDGGLQFFAEFQFALRRGQVLQAAVVTYLASWA